ncbi:MAG: polymerase subunit sigma-24 [Frankiales bacterium]|nr:polymerase subunit sigma-24 [Frankiales bacterium]
MTVTDIAAGLTAEIGRNAQQLPPPRTRRALRQAAGLSTEQLGHVLGVTRQTVSNWETGRRTPRGEQLVAYLEALRFLRQAA